MRIVFAHGHKFRRLGSRWFTPGGLPGTVLDRYVKAFGPVTVVARAIDLDEEPATLTEITHPSVDIVGLRRRDRRAEVERAVANADAVIVRLPSGIGELAWRMARKIGKPCLVELVGCPWDSLWNHSFAGKVVAPFRFVTTRYIAARSSHVLYVTDEFLQGRYPSPGITVGCSDVVIPDRARGVLEARRRRIRSMRRESLTLATVAAVDVRYKGHEYALEALRLLKERGVKAEYLAIGGGDPTRLQGIARHLGVESQVRFTGALPKADVEQLLEERVDLYIQPSLAEGTPRALVEAMSLAIPCIGADSGGVAELLPRERVVDRRDGKAIADLIVSLDKSDLDAMAVENFEAVKRKFPLSDLTARRNGFFAEFRAYVETQEGE